MTDEDDFGEVEATEPLAMPNISEKVHAALVKLAAPRGTGKTVAMVLDLFEAIGKPEVTEALVIVANAGQASDVAECIQYVWEEAQRVLDDDGVSQENRQPAPRLERDGLVLFLGAHIFIVPVNDLDRAEKGLPSGTPRFVDHFALEHELCRLLRPTL